MKMSWIRKIVINGRHVKTKEDFHREIEGLGDIDGYGANLDALYDELTASSDLIIIENTDDFKKNLGADADRIIEVFEDAMDNNDELIVLFE